MMGSDSVSPECIQRRPSCSIRSMDFLGPQEPGV
jgi:hypothetical protein